jgi:Family of unknown function (DUF5906)/Primase C terminal 2 (PriCT-2)/Bifunctional DNA primase/polymerase, N-terminal
VNQTFETLAPLMDANGYPVLPVPLRAKEPGFNGWTGYQYKAQDLKLHAGRGISILTGKVIALDIDVRNAKTVAEIEALAEKMLGTAPRRIGAAPKVARLYRVAKPIKKITGTEYVMPGDSFNARSYKPHKIEILGQGQHLNCFNIHQMTDKPYRWNGAGDPTTVKAADLVLVAPKKIETFVRDAEAIIEKHGGKPYKDKKEAKAREATQSEATGKFSAREWDDRNYQFAADALAYLDPDCAYDDWRDTAFAIFDGSNGSKRGHELTLAWSRGDLTGKPAAMFDEQKFDVLWKSCKPGGGITRATLFAKAKEAGWVQGATPQGQDDGTNAPQEIEVRAAVERALAKRIGAGTDIAPVKAGHMTKEQMIDRFVYLEDSNEVCDLDNPRLAMSLDHFKNFTASSLYETEPNKQGNTRLLPIADQWRVARARQNIATRTWHPGAGQFTVDPNGRPAINIWLPPADPEPPADWQQRAQLFVEHIRYLIANASEREAFLDWFAHVEQRPGEAVHAHYLFIAPVTQGIGRNYLGSLAARLWSGNVALSVNLFRALEGNFNAELSECLFAVVDEVHEGVKGLDWKLVEALKSELTREQRLINPKFGRQHVEYARTRWLMLSNHLLALPLSEQDRRFYVVENPTVPRAADYYIRLYDSLNDPAFIASVRQWLRRRDISKFNPGARPVVSDIKRQMIESVKSDEDRAVEELVSTWPSDVITQAALQKAVFGGAVEFGSDSAKRAAMVKSILSRLGGGAYRKSVKWAGKMQRVAILRNRAKWFDARPDQITAQLRVAEQADEDAHHRSKQAKARVQAAKGAK